MGKALADIGLTAALHPHTGTCIEKRDHVYGVLEAVDTKYVKFGPDVGQLAKGGADPVEIVKNFLELVEHVHLKDWDGGPLLGRLLPTWQGQGGHPDNSGSSGKVKDQENDHGRIGLGRQECADGADRNGPNRQGVSRDPGLHIPNLEEVR